MNKFKDTVAEARPEFRELFPWGGMEMLAAGFCLIMMHPGRRTIVDG